MNAPFLKPKPMVAPEKTKPTPWWVPVVIVAASLAISFVALGVTKLAVKRSESSIVFSATAATTAVCTYNQDSTTAVCKSSAGDKADSCPEVDGFILEKSEGWCTYFALTYPALRPRI